MRKIKLLIILFISSFILNCSSDKVNNIEEVASLFGEWELTTKLIGENTKELNECEQGEGVIFSESLLIAKFIVVTENTTEQCYYRDAEYNLFVDEENKFLYLIVSGEGTNFNVDDYIAKFEIEVLSSENLRIKLIQETWKGKIDDFEINKIEIEKNEQQTYVYKRK